MIRATLDLVARASVTLVGIGELTSDAPLYSDGFITDGELKALRKAGAVGEIVGWAFDRDGRLIEGLTNDRVTSATIPSRETSLVVGIAMGKRKLPGILAAVTRRLLNGLITDELTAEALLRAG
jgi:DNA-binding transcriptional regulator LsrR (DeoR family)